MLQIIARRLVQMILIMITVSLILFVIFDSDTFKKTIAVHELGVRQVKVKLRDLDALYEVVHEEVEDTALDVAATLRSVRAGAGMVGKSRRWLVRR